MLLRDLKNNINTFDKQNDGMTSQNMMNESNVLHDASIRQSQLRVQVGRERGPCQDDA